MTSDDRGSLDRPDGDDDAPGRSRAHPEPARDSTNEGERLQKVMAAAGVASRRVSEDLIAAGRVSVNGQVVAEPGRRVLSTDLVSVDGTAIQLDPSRRYLMLNKPVGIVSSLADENGRPDLSLYTREYDERLFNVGRLDAQTSGLLVLTNDGELAHVLAHPSFGVSKTYVAKVRGEVSAATLRRLTTGVELDDGPIAADRVKLIGKPSRGQSMVEVELHSGRNRIVRRMLAAADHPVLELVRRQFGPLSLGSLGSGQIRDLTKVELGQLLTLSRSAREPSAEHPKIPADHRIPADDEIPADESVRPRDKKGRQ
ncbi:MAG TPA: pseudouridine synthase [Galbitalea sp.]|nr:pseudouridine synthase [Galbitalea sp.]